MLMATFVALDAQAVVKCEGETVKSVWVKNNLNPEWNIQCIFYRKKPDVPITVEVSITILVITDETSCP